MKASALRLCVTFIYFATVALLLLLLLSLSLWEPGDKKNRRVVSFFLKGRRSRRRGAMADKKSL